MLISIFSTISKTPYFFDNFFSKLYNNETMTIFISIAAFLLLIISAVANVLVRITLKPKQDDDLDDYYCEFEDQHPRYRKYLKWSRITYTGICAAILLLFLAMVF